MSQVTDLVTRLTADVAAEHTQVDSVLTLIAGIPALITAAVNDALAANPSLNPADLQSLTDAAANIEGQTSALAAAVAANVPSPGVGTGSGNAGSAGSSSPNTGSDSGSGNGSTGVSPVVAPPTSTAPETPNPNNPDDFTFTPPSV